MRATFGVAQTCSLRHVCDSLRLELAFSSPKLRPDRLYRSQTSEIDVCATYQRSRDRPASWPQGKRQQAAALHTSRTDVEHAYSQPSWSDRRSTLEDSSDSTSPTQDSRSDVQDGRSRTKASAEPIQNPKSKIQNGKRPYVRTPARLAAARANLQKARAAPKEKVYRLSEKRLAANRANLAKAKAARQQELEEMVDRLDIVFPPLGKEISAEALGPEVRCFCGSGKPYQQCCKARKAKTGIPGLDFPRDPQSDPRFDFAQGQPAESRGEAGEDDRPQVSRTFFRFGSPKWCEDGVDREAPDYGALEKAGRALLHRQRALVNEVRREGREVMRLLTQAAARTAVPTLQDILALACGLMTVLTKSRLLGRAKQLNQRVEKLLEAFLEKRYERAGVVVSPTALLERMLADAESPPLHRRQKRARPGAAKREHRAQRTKPAKRRLSDAGPDLPDNQPEFDLLVRRAFCAPHPEPEKDPLCHLIDELSDRLWSRLHTFQVELKYETERLAQMLDQMDDILPHEGCRTLLERLWMIEGGLKEAMRGAEPMMEFCLQDIARRLGTLIRLRYGSDPEIDRFGRRFGL